MQTDGGGKSEGENIVAKYACSKCRLPVPLKAIRKTTIRHADGSIAGYDWLTACCNALPILASDLAILESEEAEVAQAQAEQDAQAGESAYIAERQAEGCAAWQAKQGEAEAAAYGGPEY